MIMKWIKLKDKNPSVDDDGKKVLVHRVVNDSQSSMAISILDTHLLKYCDENETHWMPLPEPPNK